MTFLLYSTSFFIKGFIKFIALQVSKTDLMEEAPIK